MGSIPGLGKSSGEGNDNPLKYSCLENSMDREAWRAIVHEVAKSWTRLSTHTLYYNLYHYNSKDITYFNVTNDLKLAFIYHI